MREAAGRLGTAEAEIRRAIKVFTLTPEAKCGVGSGVKENLLLGNLSKQLVFTILFGSIGLLNA